MAQDGSGLAAVERFIGRRRTLCVSILLSFVGIATGGACAAAILQHTSSRTVLVVGAGVVVGAVALAARIRHSGLALLTALAPLPGLIWAAPMNGGSSFGWVPVLAYAVAFAIAAVCARIVVLRVLGGEAERHPGWCAAAALGLFAVLAQLWTWRTAAQPAAWQAMADVVLASASALLLVPVGASFLIFDEQFIANANRAQERQQRVLETVSLIATPRWGLSVAGIALVFVALGWFAAFPAGVQDSGVAIRSAVSVLLAAMTVGALCRDWRDAVGAAVACVVVALISLWGPAHHDPYQPIYVLETVTLALFLILLPARRALSYRRRHEPSARARALEDCAPALVQAGVGAALVMLPGAAINVSGGAYAAGCLFAAAGAVCFTPAVAAAIEALFPRRQSVEDIYGKH